MLKGLLDLQIDLLALPVTSLTLCCMSQAIPNSQMICAEQVRRTPVPAPTAQRERTRARKVAAQQINDETLFVWTSD